MNDHTSIQRTTTRVKILIIGLLMIFPLFALAATASAQSFRSGGNVTVASEDTVNSTLYASGRSVDVAGTVNGDVFCAAQNVTISGDINGDILCAAQTIQISGTVSGSARLAAQTVTISGSIDRNASIAAQSITADTRSSFGGDVSVISTDAVFNGNINRDLAIGAATATINGDVGRNVNASIETLRLGSSAVINGGIEYTSQKDLTREPGTRVNGSITRNEPQKQTTSDDKDALPLFGLYLILAMLLVSLVLVLLFPQVFQRAANATLASPWSTLLIGLATSIIVPIVIFIIMLTIIGIPLGLLALFAWIVVLFLSGPFAAFLLGRIMWGRGATNAIWVMLFGSAVLLLLYFFPIINFFVMLLALWFGLGMIVRTLRFQSPRYRLASPAGSMDATTAANITAPRQTKTKSATQKSARAWTTKRKR